MKTRILIPVLALLFGICSAFIPAEVSTDPSHYNNSPEDCIDCAAVIDVAANCQLSPPMVNPVRCECKNAAQSAVPAQNEDCDFLWRKP